MRYIVIDKDVGVSKNAEKYDTMAVFRVPCLKQIMVSQVWEIFAILVCLYEAQGSLSTAIYSNPGYFKSILQNLIDFFFHKMSGKLSKDH